jgi:hypothetical protein
MKIQPQWVVTPGKQTNYYYYYYYYYYHHYYVQYVVCSNYTDQCWDAFHTESKTNMRTSCTDIDET